jgi:hypothetical protein
MTISAISAIAVMTTSKLMASQVRFRPPIGQAPP